MPNTSMDVPGRLTSQCADRFMLARRLLLPSQHSSQDTILGLLTALIDILIPLSSKSSTAYPAVFPREICQR
jgi:hypothetical protein